MDSLGNLGCDSSGERAPSRERLCAVAVNHLGDTCGIPEVDFREERMSSFNIVENSVDDSCGNCVVKSRESLLRVVGFGCFSKRIIELLLSVCQLSDTAGRENVLVIRLRVLLSDLHKVSLSIGGEISERCNEGVSVLVVKSALKRLCQVSTSFFD